MMYISIETTNIAGGLPLAGLRIDIAIRGQQSNATITFGALFVFFIIFSCSIFVLVVVVVVVVLVFRVGELLGGKGEHEGEGESECSGSSLRYESWEKIMMNKSALVANKWESS